MRIPLAPVLLASLLAGLPCRAENWPRWRGPNGNAVSSESGLPLRWDRNHNVHWHAPIPGEGSSSPIVWQNRVWLASALEDGTRRQLHCLDRDSGAILWTREVDDEYPELTSALTGHAAATPVTDGKRVIASFGNAGVVAYDLQGRQLWRRRFGEFESELGLASSPIIYKDTVILVCDHDGKWYSTFDSFLIALALDSGQTRWKTDRRGLERSWSTPVVAATADGQPELVVNAQEELRGYAIETGKLLWRVRGMTGWVTPSPVFDRGLIFATSGKDGPTMAVRPGGRGDVTDTHVVWQHKRGAPYVCSPLLYNGRLYVHSEPGVLRCYEARSGRQLYQQRLRGKFIASAVAADNRLYFTNEDGQTFVVRAGDQFELLATNSLGESCLASPAISGGKLFLRTAKQLWCLAQRPE